MRLQPHPSLRAIIGAALFGLCVGTAHAATPDRQQAIVQSGARGAETLQLQTVPVPAPRENEVLIRVYAAAVNPADYHARLAETGAAGAHAAPAPAAAAASMIPGQDVAGVIERVGSGVSGFKVGDPVWAITLRRPDMLNGAYAGFALAASGTVVRKPANLTYAQASALGVAGITAVRDVMMTKVDRGQRVLITGVAGGVGSFAAQAAKARGAIVIGTATPRHNAYLKSIGVDQVIDYSQGRFEDQVKDVDAVIDTVGGDTAARALTTLRRGGHFISNGPNDVDTRCAAAGVNCQPRASAAAVDRGLYEQVNALAASGALKVNVDRTFPLAEAAQAQEYGAAGHTEGKVILIVDPEHANRR